MKQWEELTRLAEAAGCRDLVCSAAEREEAVRSRTKTGVFITGGNISGKTTMINGIIGSEVREPHLISEEEEPLRIVFERMEDAAGFECKIAVNRYWNEEDAILYELKLDDIFEEDMAYKPVLDLADTVFYVISAFMPFSSEDMAAIRALSFMKVQVVISKMDLLDSDSQKKVREAVSGICTKLGLDSPIFAGNPIGEETAKEFRFALPAAEERERLREAYIDKLYQNTVSVLEKRAGQQLEENRRQFEAAKDGQLEQSLEIREKQALWGKIRVQMLEKGNALSDEVSDYVKNQVDKLGSELYLRGKEAQFSENWCEKHLPSQMEKAMKTLTRQQKELIENRMREDCRGMMERAVNLGLTTGFDMKEFDFLSLTSVFNMGNIFDINTDKPAADSRILLGTGIAIGLLLVIPLPTTLSVVGSVAAAGIGGTAYYHNRKESEELAWQKKIREYCKANLYNLAAALSDSIRDYYGKLADILREKANELTEPALEEERYQRREVELKEIIKRCQEMISE